MTNSSKNAPKQERGRKADQWRGVGSFGTIGLEIVLCIAFGFFGGRWLDEKFNTAPYLAGLGFCFGLAAAIKSVMRAHAEMQALAAREEREQGNPLPIYDKRDDDRKSDEIVKEDDSSLNDDEDAEAEEEAERMSVKKSSKSVKKKKDEEGEGNR